MAKKKTIISKVTSKESEGTPSNVCFTIMPFGGWFDFYYEDIFSPAIEATGLTPRRADDLYRPSAIVHDIWSLTQQAKIILADLTGKNPNVFYELGLAHALAKPAILVTESIDDVPFDLRSLRVIVYDKNKPDWGNILQQKIETSIREILASPLEAVLPTFLKVKDATQRPTITQEAKELISMRQDIDLLKRELQRGEEYYASRSPRFRNERDVVEFIRTYVRKGAPIDYIEHRLSKDGISPSLVRKLISEATDNRISSPEPPPQPFSAEPNEQKSG